MSYSTLKGPFSKSHFFIYEMEIKNLVAVIHALYAQWQYVMREKQHYNGTMCLRSHQSSRNFADDIFKCIFLIEKWPFFY